VGVARRPAGYCRPVAAEVVHALVRHGRTDYNDRGLLNGDPAVPVLLDDEGRAQLAALKPRIDALPVDLAVHTRFSRTVESLDILLDGRDVPRAECPELDDVRLGVFEGATREAYRAWRRELGVAARPDRGGESRVDALGRYARGFERLLATRARCALVVTHDIPIRFLSNALEGDDPIDGPIRSVANGSLLLVDAADLRNAVERMRLRLPRPGT
jgi:broad specificity phosphatase PhoE